ncbi:unnamed protein product, partial [Rotaria magnacalcarata]
MGSVGIICKPEENIHHEAPLTYMLQLIPREILEQTNLN